MKVAIYSPYLDTFGGGERYMITIAQILSSRAQIDMLLDNNLNSLGSDFLKKNLQERFDINLSAVDFVRAPVGKNSNFFERLVFMKHYDLLFYLTDGSIFYPTAKRNILHIQAPLVGQPATSFWGKIKLKAWNLIIYNSKFTKDNSIKNWPISSEVIYPPVDVTAIKPLKKKKYILSVGRFFGYLKNKKHKFLIDTFRELQEKRLAGWSLNLVGSASKGDLSYLRELKDLAKKLPVNFYPNLGYDDLIKLYGESSIYWHAQGYGEKEPTKMEHFGISTVEAMAGGCVPIVIGKGGQVEIVEHGESGFLWNSKDQLKVFTLKVIEKKDLWQKLQMGAILRSKNFSKERFTQKVINLIEI